MSYSEHNKCPVCKRDVEAVDDHGHDSVGDPYNRRGYRKDHLDRNACGHVWYYNPFLDWYKQLVGMFQ